MLVKYTVTVVALSCLVTLGGVYLIACYFGIGKVLDDTRKSVKKVADHAKGTLDDVGKNVKKVADDTGKSVGKVADCAQDTVGIVNEIKKFQIEEVWPTIRPILRLLSIILFMIAISYCDAFLKAEPRSNFETLIVLAVGVLHVFWMCVVYLALSILLEDILRVTVHVGLLVAVALVVKSLWSAVIG